MPPKKRKGSDDDETREADADAENLVTAVKRQRVSRACDQCRAARERCDGKPQCLPCVSQNRSCTYQTNPKKRGVQTGYIRTLEVALAWVFEKVPDSEAALYTLLTRQNGEGRSLLAGSNTDRFHRKWRKSRVQKGVDRVLSGGEASQHPPAENSPVSEDDSETSGETEQLPGQPSARDISQFTPASQLTPASPVSATHLSHHGPPSSRGHLETSNPQRPSTPPSRSRLKLPSNHWRLLDIYFSYTHCWLPILEKQDIFQASYQYSSDNAISLSPEDPSTAVYAELWAALALASYQDAASSTPNIPGTSDESYLSPSEIYKIARKLIPPEDGPCQVHHVRALLLLGLVNLGNENVRSAWFLIGTAVQIFLSITSQEDREQPRLRCLHIACFILDTVISATYGKPPHIEAKELENTAPIPEGALDEWQPWIPCDGFGPGRVPNLQSRNPAHCLSTFNQLYGMLKAIPRSWRPILGTRTGSLAEVQQAIHSSSPFRSFILSPALLPASVPSPYVLRIVYLWATTETNSAVNQSGPLILETLEQYIANFGVCGAPALFAACVSLLVDHSGFSSLHPLDQERLEAIRLKFRATWGQTNKPGEHLAGGTTRVEFQPALHLSAEPQRQSTAMDASPHFPDSSSVNAPTPFYNGSAILAQQAPTTTATQVYSNVQQSFIANTYRQPKPLSSMAGLAHEQGENNRRASLTNALTPVLDTLHQQHHHLHGAFNQAPMDYDALLDDLASIDYGDRIDADPQFMMNLGYAPDCDLTEILSRDLGTG